MSLDVFNLPLRTKRTLKLSRLAPAYTPEEIAKLTRKTYTYDAVPTLSHERWAEPFAELTRNAHAAKPKKIRKWSPEEDAFLRATYLYLTDSIVALALNIPANIVLARRKVLKLSKTQQAIHTPLEVIVWCERENFERDCAKTSLMKARPDVVL